MYSVIIPSVGRSSLSNVIVSLNNSTIKPFEIIVVVPECSNFDSAKILINTNVKLVLSKHCHQVLQRIDGIKHVSSKINYVCLIDDDVIVNIDSLEKLLKVADEKTVVGPIYKFLDSDTVIHSLSYDLNKSSFKRFLRNFINYFFHKVPFDLKKMGKVSCTSLSFGVPIESKNSRYFEVDWLPGGCVMSHKQNLINYNYYPIEGKCYTEDIICSYLRKKNNIKQVVAINSMVRTDEINKSAEKNKKYLVQKVNEFRGRLYYIKLTNGSYIRFYLWFIFYFLKGIFK